MPSAHGLDRGVEVIPDAPLGADEDGASGIGFDLAAQTKDLHVDGAVGVIGPLQMKQTLSGDTQWANSVEAECVA